MMLRTLMTEGGWSNLGQFEKKQKLEALVSCLHRKCYKSLNAS